MSDKKRKTEQNKSKLAQVEEFINASIDQYALDRWTDQSADDVEDKDKAFSDMAEFTSAQHAALRALNENEINDLCVLMRLIERGVKHVDMEIMTVAFPLCGFFFDKEGTLVTVNDR